MTIDQANQLYTQYHGRSLGQEDIAALGGQGAIANLSPDQLTNTITSSQEYRDRQARLKQQSDPEFQKQQLLQQQRDAQNALLARQKAEQEGLFNQFQTTSNAQEKLTDVYNRLAKESGLTAMQGAFNDVNSQLLHLKDTINNRIQQTGGLSESQRQREIATQSDPLQRRLAELATGVSQSSQNLGTQLQLTEAQQQKELDPLKMRIAAFSDQAAREMTGFNQQRESEFTFLMDKLQRERQLSDREWQQTADLAKMDTEFANKKSELQMQYENQAKQVNAVDLGDKVAIMDSSGKVIRYESKGKIPGSSSGSTDLTSLTNNNQTGTNTLPPAPGQPGAVLKSNSEGIKLARSAKEQGESASEVLRDLMAAGVTADNATRMVSLAFGGY